MAKSYLKEFVYDSKDGESNRALFVMRENDTAFDGFETTYLEPEETEKLKEYFAEHEIKETFEKTENFTKEGDDNNFNPAWMKTWRRYNKSKIIVKD